METIQDVIAKLEEWDALFHRGVIDDPEELLDELPDFVFEALPILKSVYNNKKGDQSGS
jgi:hypothetical protein